MVGWLSDRVFGCCVGFGGLGCWVLSPYGQRHQSSLVLTFHDPAGGPEEDGGARALPQGIVGGHALYNLFRYVFMWCERS